MSARKTGECATVNSKTLSKNDFREKCAKKFTSVMLEKNVSYNTLSKATGLSFATIVGYGCGRSIPTLYTLQLIAEALDCSIDEFRV